MTFRGRQYVPTASSETFTVAAEIEETVLPKERDLDTPSSKVSSSLGEERRERGEGEGERQEGDEDDDTYEITSQNLPWLDTLSLRVSSPSIEDNRPRGELHGFSRWNG